MLPKVFLVDLVAFSVSIDLPNSGQERLCEKLHLWLSKEMPSFWEEMPT